MYKINANEKGSRTIKVSDDHLRILEKYDLLDHLADSNGVVDENTLSKLRFTVTSLMEGMMNDMQTLLSLQKNVIQHNDMKALGLANLIALYQEHKPTAEEPATESEPWPWQNTASATGSPPPRRKWN